MIERRQVEAEGIWKGIKSCTDEICFTKHREGIMQ